MTESPWYIDEDIAVVETLVPAGFANIDVYHTYCADLIDVLFAVAMETDPSWVKGEESATLARTARKGPRSPEPLQKWYESSARVMRKRWQKLSGNWFTESTAWLPRR